MGDDSGFAPKLRGILALVAAVAVLGLGGCAKERPVKPILASAKRVAKTDLQGTFNYLRSVNGLSYSGGMDEFLASGMYLHSDVLVQFVIKETSLDVVAMDPLFSEERNAEVNGVLLSFPVRHVDVLRKQNIDGNDTHEEEETETRRPWKEREYLVIDLTQNKVDYFKGVKSVSPSEGIAIDRERGALGFGTTKQLENDSIVSERYSFLKFQPSSTYEQKLYPRSIQDRFGVFKTVTYAFDKFGRRTQDLKQEFMNRWDTSKKVVYYLSKDFPVHLKPVAEEVFRTWNRAFVAATGHEVLELRPNSGQEAGDLRYSMVHYDDSREENGLLGYGPSVTNPRTGEIIKGDVFIYGGTLKRAVHNERLWGQLLGDKGRTASLSLEATTPSVASVGRFVADAATAKRLSKKVPDLRAQLNALIASGRSENGKEPLLLKNLRARVQADNSRRITRINEEVLEALFEGLTKDNLTDEELEIQIFTPLLAHELGHTLGLRHNFMASADESHFAHGFKSSSVMDYGFLSSHEPAAPGPYDAAVIKVAYGRDAAETEKLLAERFFFCTDENLFDARYGLCHQFDAGKSLSEIALNQMKRYISSYNFNNLRMDRVSFTGVDDAYMNRVFMNFITLRLVFDHADAIYRTGLPAIQGQPLTDEALAQLWILLRRRIEPLPGEEAMEVPIRQGLTVKVALPKVAEAIVDAARVRNQVFQYLQLVVNEEERPDYDQEDLLFHDLQVRGVLYDRMLSLLVLSLRTPDPLGGGTGVSLFEPMHEPMSRLFTGILSNTETVKEEATGKLLTRIRFYDTNVREMTLGLVQDLISSPSLEAGEIKEMLKLERLQTGDRDSDLFKRLDQSQTEFRQLLVEFEKTTDPAKEAELREKITKNREARNEIDLATATVRDGIALKSTVSLSQFGGIPTATGLLLRDNLSLFEDRLFVLDTLITEIGAQIGAEQDPDKKLALVAQKERLNELTLLFTRYVSTEKSFIEKLYRIYSPQ